jgi:uncharacterized protein YceK
MASGCGTFANTVWWTDDEGGKRVYGGVRAELGQIKEAEGPADAARMALDLPLTVIGDTITLPFTISYSLWFRSPPIKLLNQKESASNSNEATGAARR